MIPVAYAAAGNRIVRLDCGHQDAGEPINFSIESAAVAPAGVDGDCAFDRLRQVLTGTAAATITITPLIDGVPVPEAAHTIQLEATEDRASRVFELILRRHAASGSTYGLRKTWFAIRIEGTAVPGDLIIDPASLEVEVLTPTHRRPS